MPILNYNITGNAKGIIAATNRAGAAMTGLNARAAGLGGAARTAAGTAIKAFAAVEGAILAVGTAIAIEGIRKAIDFEEAFARVRKTVDATEPEFASIRDELLRMSPALGKSNTELAELAATAGQMGVQADQIAGFTEVLAKLTVATDIVGEEGALNLGRFMAVMNQQGPHAAENAQHIADVLVNLGNRTAAMESEILEASTALAEYSAIAGVSVDHTLAFAAALVEAGEAPEGIASGIGRSFNEINSAVLEGEDALKRFADVAGVSAEEFAATWKENAGDAFVLLLRGLSNVEDKASVLKDLGLSDIRQIRTIPILAQNIGRVDEILGFVGTSAGAAQREFEEFADTSAFKIRQVIESINTLLTILGGLLLENYVAPLVEDLSEAAVAAATAASRGADLNDILATMADQSDTGSKIAEGLNIAIGAFQQAIGFAKIFAAALGFLLGGFMLLKAGVEGFIGSTVQGFGVALEYLGKFAAGIAGTLDAMNNIPGLGALIPDSVVAKAYDLADGMQRTGRNAQEFGSEFVNQAAPKVKDALAGIKASAGLLSQGWLDVEQNYHRMTSGIEGNPLDLMVSTEQADAEINRLEGQARNWENRNPTAQVLAETGEAHRNIDKAIGKADDYATMYEGTLLANPFRALRNIDNVQRAADGWNGREARAFLTAWDHATHVIRIVKAALDQIPPYKETVIATRYVGLTASGAVGSQHGGPRRAGQLLLVGEAGPELFVPNTSGTVVPNHRMGDYAGGGRPVGGGTTINVTVEGSVVTEDQLASLVHERLLRKQRGTRTLGFN